MGLSCITQGNAARQFDASQGVPVLAVRPLACLAL